MRTLLTTVILLSLVAPAPAVSQDESGWIMPRDAVGRAGPPGDLDERHPHPSGATRSFRGQRVSHRRGSRPSGGRGGARTIHRSRAQSGQSRDL